jgi:predicted kinase
MKSLQFDKPHAIVVVGIRGSGKSFFAKKFADTFNAPFLDQALFDQLAIDSKSSRHLQAAMLDELLKTGRSIVIEQSLSSRTERTELSRTLRKAGYAPLYVWVQVDIETAMNRAYRNDGISASEYKDTVRRFTPPNPAEKPLVVSGKHTFATQAKVVLRKLSSPRPAQENPIRIQPPQRGQITIR